MGMSEQEAADGLHVLSWRQDQLTDAEHHLTKPTHSICIGFWKYKMFPNN